MIPIHLVLLYWSLLIFFFSSFFSPEQGQHILAYAGQSECPAYSNSLGSILKIIIIVYNFDPFNLQQWRALNLHSANLMVL